MEDVDIQDITEFDDDDMLFRHVARGEHELLYIDSYLRDVFGEDSHLGEGSSEDITI